jgi:Holliday junction DNA helicase, RuvA subunit
MGYNKSMIAHIFGKVVEKFGNSVIIDVTGVGYEVKVTDLEFDELLLDAEVKLYTHHHIREQSQELFGFSTLAGKKLFELLTTVQGIGPKAAMAILSIAECEVVRNAIANEDAVFVAKATGVGKRSAERVIVDLKDKVGTALAYDTQEQVKMVDGKDEALEALMALGYNLADAMKALEEVPKNLGTAERVTLALKQK